MRILAGNGDNPMYEKTMAEKTGTFLGIIPARYASSRFPGKPLADIGGKSMIERVYEQASKASCFSEVIVATDDGRIEKHVRAFGGKVVMTSPHHRSGTERCCEVIEKMKGIGNDDVVFNIQGDEPFIEPSQLELLATCFDDKNTRIATLAKKLNNPEQLHNPNVPKVIFNNKLEAIYFSRAPLPWCRDEEKEKWLSKHSYYKHIGIYSYRAGILKEIAKLPPTGHEVAESLEQLRWIDNGYKIKIALTDRESISIDTPDDLERAKKLVKT